MTRIKTLSQLKWKLRNFHNNKKAVWNMAVFNSAKREIDIKIVYYGPALCGKTTNVQCVHNKLKPDQRGEIVSLATKDDRTLFFDFLPIELGDIKGFKTRFHVYTVPGQVYYALTRRAVLTGVDGIIFVADSQSNKLDENLESLKDLDENLKYYNKNLAKLPFVIQYNKRDLEEILSVDELNSALNNLDVPFFEASAIGCKGVIETLTECCKLVLKHMNRTSKDKKTTHEEAISLCEDEMDLQEPVIKITSEDISVTQEINEPLTVPNEIEYSQRSSLPHEQALLSIDEPEIHIESHSAGIPSNFGAGLKVVSCGQPRKVTETSITVPIVFKVEQQEKEYMVNINISFDDFKLLG
jgi:hypothetical protein